MDAIVRNLDAYLMRAKRGEDTVLLPRQLETAEKIRDFIAAGYMAGHVVKPTGIGKTVIFCKFLEAALVGMKTKALIIGQTKINLRQNQWKLDAFADITAGAFYTASRDLSHQVTVTTYHSLRNAVRDGRINPHDYGFLILDEAHRALGDETVAAIDKFESAIKIGFTATPEFHEEKSVADILPFLIDEMSVREAIEGNLLAGLQVFILNTGISAKDIALKGQEFEEMSLCQVINTPERNRFVARAYHHPLFSGKRAVVYAASRQHGRALTFAFEQEKIPVAYVDGMTPETERESIFDKFKSGEIKVLCNVRVLVESFDEPEAEVCFNAAPVLSKVIAEQRGGRVLRRSKLRDSKMGYIVEVLDDFGDSFNTPVLFSEIAGAAEILAPSNRDAIKKESIASKPVVRKVNKAPVPGELVDDSGIIMDITNRNKRQRFTRMFEYAPRGWSYARRMAYELHVKESAIREVAEGVVGSSRVDWFKRYLTSTDILVLHYHPELASKVRKHFNPDLVEMVTPSEYAQIAVIGDAEAESLLEAADEVVSTKAVRFGDTAYFSLKEHGSIIQSEYQGARQEEELLIKAAEDLFWTDEDLSDDDRERLYWGSFDDISTEAKGVHVVEFDADPLLHGDETDQLNEDLHVALVLDESSIGLNAGMCEGIREWITHLPVRYQKVVQGYHFDDKGYRVIGESLNIGYARANQLMGDAYKLLRSRRYLLFARDRGIISDDRVVSSYSWLKVKDISYRGVTPESRKILEDLERKYLGFFTYADAYCSQ